MKLKDIIRITNAEQYKIHVAKTAYGNRPLDVFARSWDEWLIWNSNPDASGRDKFSREYIISFIDFYPQNGIFLFGGIFKVLGRNWDKANNFNGEFYDIELCEDYKELIGRLKVKGINTGRGSAFNFENHFDKIEITELLEKPYSHQFFPGFEFIDYDFLSIKYTKYERRNFYGVMETSCKNSVWEYISILH